MRTSSGFWSDQCNGIWSRCIHLTQSVEHELQNKPTDASNDPQVQAEEGVQKAEMDVSAAVNQKSAAATRHKELESWELESTDAASRGRGIENRKSKMGSLPNYHAIRSPLGRPVSIERSEIRN
jgi:hypothetical protein